MTTLAEAVDRGVMFLDGTIPDWREHIDLHTLDLSNPYSCVLGQVFASGDFHTSWHVANVALAQFEDDALLGDPEMEHSLVSWYGFEQDSYLFSYEDLDGEWRHRIGV